MRLVELPRGLAVTFGVPGMLLAIAGVVQLAARPRPSPVQRLVAMWLAVCGFFMVVGIVTPVDLRHLLAALPVIGILVAIGFAGGWRSGPIGRALGVAAAGWMAWVCAVSWTGALGH
jgi:Na+/glutamate symporter